jgi:DNA-binding transcriptional MerR regulator
VAATEAAHDPPAGGSLRAALSIGEVLAQLRPEFPDVTISKLRFLEAEGLVEPQRTPSGYRKYTAAHLDRLRFVLAAQRDRYLPLRVIRDQLAALDRGERVVGLPAPTPTAAVPAPAASPDRPSPVPVPRVVPAEPPTPSPVPARGELADARLTRSQLTERSGLDEAGLVDLEQYGLLVPGSNGYYGSEALTVARIAAQLGEFGLEGRHLRPYRATADREVGLLAQLITPLARQAAPGGREQALETVHELATLCAQLHGALVRQGLRQVLGA